MDELDPLMLFQNALESPCGIALKTADHRTAKQLRRQLYAARELLREEGNCEADQLSFVAQVNGELWLVIRSPVKSQLKSVLSIRTLGENEAPRDLKPRGKSRLTALRPLLHSLRNEC